MHKPEDSEQKQWSSRSVGRNWQHQIFYLLIRLGGRRAAYALLYVVVGCYVLFSRLARKRAEPYLSVASLTQGGPCTFGTATD